eukprot:scpid28771/ scgid33601/ Gag-Pro-Pol polyprotein; Pr160Gag-Pro-Pol; Matrix protein p19; Capsid protein p24; Nucleocapsid protein p15-pro; Protease; p1; Reverse transcriptase/ribonuclease H; Integrase
MQYGFRIGSFRPIASSVMSPNHSSACACPAEVTTHLLNCCDRGETAGPFASPPFPHMHISGLGAIPKSNGKLRIIHDLSPPAGLSVNDGISRDEFSLQYETVDTAISLIMQAGRGALLTKVDIRNAFRLCPVAPCDWPLLGIFWQGQFYHDKVLPFGLRSAPYIFDKFATAVQFILEDACHLSQLLHYLDDFLNVSPPHLPVAEHHRSLILDMLRYLQIPVASEKVEGPSTCLTFLGLELDSLTFEIRLPSAKHGAYLGKVNGLLQSGMASRRELASVLGNLSFAARAIPVGRTFLRRLYDLDRATSNLPKHKVLSGNSTVIQEDILSFRAAVPGFLSAAWRRGPAWKRRYTVLLRSPHAHTAAGLGSHIYVSHLELTRRNGPRVPESADVPAVTSVKRHSPFVGTWPPSFAYHNTHPPATLPTPPSFLHAAPS